ncbi:Major facilitator superfamily domain, general substrate transporter [Cordyceps fumosorosea ARSEF 2679]|uniref:Major facilitator superfamily domain, general substrate transporter n=1 Tax=Cordyceps fumosorosea (strain ARSEF 2679) TaxID=1081104 RepID=A0A167VVE9_CORFA|nr:Major facilitator superfamily domain, general substrate transporter [Cordyceps fumosorosea ARSEF 2679]OAA63023.1 Major facilitator superfamily domain, general substrate transporter [Cordyceps fumosorosea ARSEF 2679]
MATTTSPTEADLPSKEEKLKATVEELGSENDKTGHIEYVLSKQQLVVAFAAIFILLFVQELTSGIFRVLNPYVTSEFERHSLTATTAVVSSIIGAVSNLPVAKLFEVWGRMQVLALMVGCMLLGIVLLAACDSVETYCAAQVFYTVGLYGIKFCIVVFITDTTALRNRAFFIGFTGSPVLATLWAYGPLSDSILRTIGFRWGFGLWAPVYLVVSLPVLAVLRSAQRAKRSEVAGVADASETALPLAFWEKVVHHAKLFDVVGILIISTGLTLLLLAVSIYSYQADGWRSPLIICFLVFGALLLPVFCLYERYLASSTFIPWSIFTSRTVVATNLMVLTLQAGQQLANAYFYSFLIVVFRQTIANATYISNIYYIASTITNLVLGVVVRRFGRIKWFALCGGVPLVMLSVGLMIKFRTPDTHIGLIILSQFLNAFGGGILHPLEQITLMVESDHEHVPALLAVEGTFAIIGKGIGFALAGAIWTGMFKDRLARYLPASEMPHLESIYGSIKVQSSYAMDSETYRAIAHAYGDTQRAILLASIGIFVVTLVLTALWRDINVNKVANRQNKRW